MNGRGWRLFRLISMLLVISSLACAFIISESNEVMFWVMLCIISLVGIAYLALFLRLESNIHSFVTEMESQLNLTERDSLYKFPAPALIVDGSGIIIWFNKAFTEQIHPSDAFGVHISKIIDIDLEQSFELIDTVVEYHADHYRVRAVTTSKKDEDDKDFSELTLLYFQDISEMIELRREYTDSRSHAGYILIDSFEEMFSRIKDSDRAQITMQIDKLIEQFTDEYDVLLKKVSNDKYFIVLSEKQLARLEEEKFKSILDEARKIFVSDHTPLTLSIGIGRGGSSMRESEDLAKQALDMTQGRGGDQVAIRDDNDFTFFGGNSKGLEKSTKVKTRIFGTGLVSLVENSDNVIVMGHSWGDLDAVGAAAGLCGAIKCMGYNAWVYSDTEHTLASPIIRRLKENLDDGEDMFITEDDALDMMTERTLLIIVDTCSKALLDSKKLYERAQKIVYIDHHRQVVDSIDNEVISLHEPYASSACEMVAEVIQYFPMTKEISGYYADAMLAGIMLDTKDFVMKTGVRTFEAAAYLKKLGADTVAVKLLFASSMETGVARSGFIKNAKIYNRCAIAATESTAAEVRVAAAQAADELLSITGVDASFVLFPAGTGVNISARSFGAMNVQIIMEKLGGGGHQTMAAAQLKDVSINDAGQQLVNAIDEFILSIS